MFIKKLRQPLKNHFDRCRLAHGPQTCHLLSASEQTEDAHAPRCNTFLSACSPQAFLIHLTKQEHRRPSGTSGLRLGCHDQDAALNVAASWGVGVSAARKHAEPPREEAEHHSVGEQLFCQDGQLV